MPAHVAWFTGGLNVRGLIADTERPGVYTNGRQRWLVCSNVDTQRLFDEELDRLGFQLKEWQWATGRAVLLGELVAGKKVAADRPFPNMPLVNDRLRPELRPLAGVRAGAVPRPGPVVAHAVEATARNIGRGRDRGGDRRAGGAPAVPPRGGGGGRQRDGRRPGRRKFRRAGFTAAAGRARTCVIQATGTRDGLYVTARRTVCFGPPERRRSARSTTRRVRLAAVYRSLSPAGRVDRVGGGGGPVADGRHAVRVRLAAQPAGLRGRAVPGRGAAAGRPGRAVRGRTRPVVWQARVGPAAVVDTVLVGGRRPGRGHPAGGLAVQADQDRQDRAVRRAGRAGAGGVRAPATSLRPHPFASSSSTSRRTTSFGAPLLAFITSPTIAIFAGSLPFLKSATTFGFAATAAAAAARRAASSKSPRLDPQRRHRRRHVDAVRPACARTPCAAGPGRSPPSPSRTSANAAAAIGKASISSLALGERREDQVAHPVRRRLAVADAPPPPPRSTPPSSGPCARQHPGVVGGQAVLRLQPRPLRRRQLAHLGPHRVDLLAPSPSPAPGPARGSSGSRPPPPCAAAPRSRPFGVVPPGRRLQQLAEPVARRVLLELLVLPLGLVLDRPADGPEAVEVLDLDQRRRARPTRPAAGRGRSRSRRSAGCPPASRSRRRRARAASAASLPGTRSPPRACSCPAAMTISSSGVPVRLRSTRVSPPRPDSSCSVLAGVLFEVGADDADRLRRAALLRAGGR